MKVPDFVEYRYSDAEWDTIKNAVPNALRREFDQSRRSMEAVVSAYLPQAALNRQRPNRADLETLRKDAESLRARIDVALAERFIMSTKADAIPRPGVSRDMLDATSTY